jgi:diacylglycerol kinase family enzyme
MPDAAGVRIFLNASAGRGTIKPDDLARRLGGDLPVIPVAPGVLGARLREALRDAPPVIGVAGGDGTMRAAASVIAGTDTILACIPTGTLNNFARRIGIESIEDAAAALRTGRAHALPVGTVGDDVFLNTLTFGEYSRIVRVRERLRPAVGKWPGALLAFGVALATFRRIRVMLTTEQRVLSRATPLVWVGVGHGSFPRVHEALERRRSPDLEVAVIRSGGRARSAAFVLRLGLRMARGQQPVRDRALEVLHTRSLTIDSGHRIDATADGEVMRLQPPVEVGLRDGALHVLGPGSHFAL